MFFFENSRFHFAFKKIALWVSEVVIFEANASVSNSDKNANFSVRPCAMPCTLVRTEQ